MKICFLEGDMSRRGGTERATALLANALSSEHQVTVVSLNFSNGEFFFNLLPTVQHLALSPSRGKLGIIQQIFKIHGIIKQKKFDRVINVDTGMGFYGILAAIGTPAKVITWEHANFFNNWGSKVFPFLRRFAARHSDAMVVLTNCDKKNFETHIPRHAPIHVIYNPVDLHKFHYNTESRIILSAGLLTPIKRFDRAIEVAKTVLLSRPEWTWIICGEGPERYRLEALIAENGLIGRVLLPGVIRNMDEQYRNAAIFVMTSDMEGLPMVLLEAKSWGLPILSFDIMTGPSDIVTDGLNGRLIAPCDVNAMADTLAELMDDSPLRYKYTQNTQIDMSRFSFDHVLSEWFALLEGC